jgi:hypothetical protein
MPTPRDPLSVPLPLEQYSHAFDELFHTHLQRWRFREYLAGRAVAAAGPQQDADGPGGG